MVGVGVPSQQLVLSAWEAALISWEAWDSLCLVECLKPCLPDLTWLPTWPAWELPLLPWEGWVFAWEELLPSQKEGEQLPGRYCFLPSEEGEQLPGRNCLLPWEEGEQWPGRNHFLPWEEGEQLPGENCFLPHEEGEQLPEKNCFFPWRESEQLPGRNCLLPQEEGEQLPGRTASFPGRKVSSGLGWRIAAFPEGRWVPKPKPAWEALGPFHSLGKRKGLAGGVLLPSPEGRWAPACLLATRLLPAWGELLLETLVIFLSFLLTKFWNLLSCLCLTLLNLISPTLSMKPWHSLSLCVEIIDAKLDLHSSVCWCCLGYSNCLDSSLD